MLHSYYNLFTFFVCVCFYMCYRIVIIVQRQEDASCIARLYVYNIVDFGFSVSNSMRIYALLEVIIETHSALVALAIITFVEFSLFQPLQSHFALFAISANKFNSPADFYLFPSHCHSTPCRNLRSITDFYMACLIDAFFILFFFKA